MGNKLVNGRGGRTVVQLGSRIAEPLHRELKLHCVRTAQQMDRFLARAIRVLLDQEKRRGA